MVSKYRALKRICYRQTQCLRRLNNRIQQLLDCYRAEAEVLSESEEFHYIIPYTRALELCAIRYKIKVESTIMHLQLAKPDIVKADQNLAAFYEKAFQLQDQFEELLQPFTSLHLDCEECVNITNGVLSGNALNGLFRRQMPRTRVRTQKTATKAKGKTDIKSANEAPLQSQPPTKPANEFRRDQRAKTRHSFRKISTPHHRIFNAAATEPVYNQQAMPSCYDRYNGTRQAPSRPQLDRQPMAKTTKSGRVFHRWKMKDISNAQSSANSGYRGDV